MTFLSGVELLVEINKFNFNVSDQCQTCPISRENFCDGISSPLVCKESVEEICVFVPFSKPFQFAFLPPENFFLHRDG